MKLFVIVILLFFSAWNSKAQSAVDILVDNFNRSNLATGPTGYSTSGSIIWNSFSTGPTIATSGTSIVRIANSSTAGSGYTYFDNNQLDNSFSSVSTTRYFNPSLGLTNQIGTVEWSLNARARNGSSSSKYVIVLAASGTDFNTASGYAIYLRRSITRRFSLCSFTNGVYGTVNEIISEGNVDDLSDNQNWASLKVTFNPLTDAWSLFFRDEASTTTYQTTDVVNQKGSSVVNTDYVNSTLRYTGLYWIGNTAGSTSGDFDNFKMQISNYPYLFMITPSTFPYLVPGFAYNGAGPSLDQVITFQGANLTDKVGLKLQLNQTRYQMSLTSGSGYSDTLTIWPDTALTSPTYGILSPTTVYVRMVAGLASGSTYADTIRLNSKSALNRWVRCSGQVSSTSYVAVSPSGTKFNNTNVGSNSAAKSFTVYGSNLGITPVTVTAPANFTISTDNISFTNSISITPTTGLVSTLLYARYSPSGSGNYADSLTITHATGGTVRYGVAGYPATFYFKGTASDTLSKLANWSSRSDLTGNNIPTRFDTSDVTYRIVTTMSNKGPWSVSGTNSKIVVGDPVFAGVTLTIPNGSPISGTVDLSQAASGVNSLVVQDPAYPSFGIMHSTSEVHLQATKNSGTTKSFGNLFIDGVTGTTVTFTGTPVVQKSLTVSTGNILQTYTGSGSYGNISMQAGATMTMNGALNIFNKNGLSCTGCTIASVSSSLNYGFYFADPIPNVTFSTTSTTRYNTFSTSTIQSIQPYTYGNIDIVNGSGARTIALSGSNGNLTNQVICNNLTAPIDATIALSGTTFLINGTNSFTGNFIGSNASSLTFGGSGGTLNFALGSRILRNLTLNTNASVTLGSSLDISAGANAGSVTIASGAVLNTANQLTLKSDSFGTARVGVSAGSVIGNVTVERFIQTKKGWRLLASPTKHLSATIRQSWQEGAVNPNPGDNNLPGYGIILTGALPSWSTDGFDNFSPVSFSSLKIYNSSTDQWDNVNNTNVGFTPNAAYMTFIRGDRSVTTTSQAPTSTILRETDQINIGTVNIALGTFASANKLTAVGNPYASAVSFSNISKTNLDSSYYLWDPMLTGSNGFGGYISLSSVNGVVSAAPVPTSGSYTTGNYDLQSGQGFLVRTSAAGTASITFTENNKVSGSRLVSRTLANQLHPKQSFRTNLYRVTGENAVLMDGVLNLFDTEYSDDVDVIDSYKILNSTENLGIAKNGSLLSIERSPLLKSLSDTIQLAISKMKQTSYRFEFLPENLTAINNIYLEDSYLHTSTLLSDRVTSYIDFVINADPASYAINRFRIVLNKQGKKSLFPIINGLVSSKNTGVSSKILERTLDINNQISIFPNPVQSGNRVSLIDQQLEAGSKIRLFSSDGKEWRLQVSREGKNNASIIIPETLSPGVYELQISNAASVKSASLVITK